MSVQCVFCNDTRIEKVDGNDVDCVWCDPESLAIVEGARKRQVTRYTAVQLRFATGDLGNAEFIDAKLFDALTLERNSLKAQLDQCQARRRQFAQETTERLNVLDERFDAQDQREDDLKGLVQALVEYADQLLLEVNGAWSYAGSTGAPQTHKDADYLRALELLNHTSEAESHE